MKQKLAVIIGSIVGALAIHGVLVACSAGGGGSVGPGAERIAHAETPAASACAQWEVKTVAPTKFTWEDVSYKDPDGTSQAIALPTLGATTLEAGWEPIGALHYSTLVRRCVK